MSNLIESLIENNYKKANELVKEHIHSIVERKMCEMKKMEAARKSEEQLDEAAKKKPKDPTASAVAKAQSLMQIMQAREAGRKIPNPKPVPSFVIGLYDWTVSFNPPISCTIGKVP